MMVSRHSNINFDTNNISNGNQLINLLNLKDSRTGNGLRQKYLTVKINNKKITKSLYNWLVSSNAPTKKIKLKNKKTVDPYSKEVFKKVFSKNDLKSSFLTPSMYRPAVEGAVFYYVINYLPKSGHIISKQSPNYINNPPTRGDFYGKGRFNSTTKSLTEAKKKKKDRCHKKADRVYGKKTSAYKSGAIVRCRKGKIWKESANIEKVLESLRDWFKKEKWVRINTSGNITGPCGTMKNKKNPSRCLPKAKASSMTKKERAATARKKKREGKKGKQFVPVK